MLLPGLYEVNPNGVDGGSGPPPGGTEDIPAGEPNNPSSQAPPLTDGTIPSDNEGYDGEIRTVIVAGETRMYIKQGGSWVLYYGNTGGEDLDTHITDTVIGSDDILTDASDIDTLGTVTVDTLTVNSIIVTDLLDIDAPANAQSGIVHSSLMGQSVGDDHTQYGLLDGRYGGQVYFGGTQPGDDLELTSNNSGTTGTPGTVFINKSGIGDGVLIGAGGTPTGSLEIVGTLNNIGISLTREENASDFTHLLTSVDGDFTIKAEGYDSIPDIKFLTYKNAAVAAGDIIFGNTQGDVRPDDTTPTVNLGSLTTKFKEIHAETLRVETLVSDEVIATIGGRIIVTPSSILGEDLTAVSTTIKLMHNSLSGHYIVMKIEGNTEYMKLGTQSGSESHADSVRTIYSYPVTRNLNGAGASAWEAGSSIASYSGGSTGDGMMELYSQSALLSPGGTGTGPTGPAILGLRRTSGTNYYDTSSCFALGNLNNLYGESADQYGIAAGDYVSNGTWMVASSEGFRIKYNKDTPVTKFSVDSYGNTRIGDSSTSSESYVYIAADDTHAIAKTGDIYLHGGSSNRYMHLDSSANTFTIKASNDSMIQLDGDAGKIFATGNIEGASLSTGTTGSRVVVADSTILSGGSSSSTGGTIASGSMAAFTEYMSGGSGDDSDGHVNDTLILGINKNDSQGATLAMGKYIAASSTTNNIIRLNCSQDAGLDGGYSGGGIIDGWSGNGNTYTATNSSNRNYLQMYQYSHDASGHLHNSIAVQLRTDGLYLYRYDSPSSASLGGHRFSTTGSWTSGPPAPGTTNLDFCRSLDKAHLYHSGYFSLGHGTDADQTGESGMIKIIPANHGSTADVSDFRATLLNQVVGRNMGNSFYHTTGSDMDALKQHMRPDHISIFASNTAVVNHQRATYNGSTTSDATVGDCNGLVSGYMTSTTTDGSGKCAIYKTCTTAGWALVFVAKPTENSSHLLLYIYNSGSTVTHTVIGSTSNSWDSITGVVTSGSNHGRLRLDGNSNMVSRYVTMTQLAGSVPMCIGPYS